MKVCQSLAQMGAEVDLLVPGKMHTPWSTLAPYYGLTFCFDMHWIPIQAALKRYDLAIRAVHKAIDMKADLLYTWLPQAAVLGLRRGLPVVLEVHDRPTGMLGPRLLRRMVEMRGRKRLALITRALQTALEDEFGIFLSDENVIIAPNGVDLERYVDLPDPAEARRRIGLTDKVTAVYTGHFYAGRGMDLLLELARRAPEMQFLWVGGNPQAVLQWQERISVLKIENITLTGFIENLHLPLYQASGDVLLMPYERSVAGSSGGNSADICSPMKMF